MLLRLKRRADSFDNWATEVKRSLDPSDPKVGELVKNLLLSHSKLFFFFLIVGHLLNSLLITFNFLNSYLLGNV